MQKALVLLLASCLLHFAFPRSGSGQAAFTPDEFRLLPLRVHLLRSKTVPQLRCKLQIADIRRILGKVNGIWRPAGILFYEESILSEEPANEELYQGLGENRTEAHLRLIRPRGSLADTVFHTYYIGEMRPNGICLQRDRQLIFVKETARLFTVPGGIDEPLPRVTAHEIGHALGLEHRQDTYNLMASGTSGTGLNEVEITTARESAEDLPWALKPDEALALAEKHSAEKRAPLATALYHALKLLPGGEVAATARKRLPDPKK